jgi:hypothetical protein
VTTRAWCNCSSGPSPAAQRRPDLAHRRSPERLREAFVGKYRGADGEIVQLGAAVPGERQVELRGQRIVYLLDTLKGRTEHGPDDILHIKAMSGDGSAACLP